MNSLEAPILLDFSIPFQQKEKLDLLRCILALPTRESVIALFGDLENQFQGGDLSTDDLNEYVQNALERGSTSTLQEIQHLVHTMVRHIVKN